MIIKNVSDINKALKIIAEQALKEAEEEVHRCIENFVRQYYSEYSPTVYQRTYQFMDSIVKTSVKTKGSEIYCEVYIDTNLDYKDATGQEVVEMINQGYHAMKKFGASRDIKGTKVWNESMEFIDKFQIFINTFKESLIKQGLDVIN